MIFLLECSNLALDSKSNLTFGPNDLKSEHDDLKCHESYAQMLIEL